ncbi:MAG: hypothetical protein HY043_20965 [Verrucomicrobia bacterium]|nr:hypothetical protein [Verrucomicrobiota bacterium]
MNKLSGTSHKKVNDTFMRMIAVEKYQKPVGWDRAKHLPADPIFRR